MQCETHACHVCLQGIANVAAVDCDEASNKPLCGQYGVKGFPTLKVSRRYPAASSWHLSCSGHSQLGLTSYISVG